MGERSDADEPSTSSISSNEQRFTAIVGQAKNTNKRLVESCDLSSRDVSLVVKIGLGNIP